MKRRTVLYGLGLVAVGTGTTMGSGAFSQTAAERDVTVDVSGDSDAALSLAANEDVEGIANDGGTEDDLLAINLDSVNKDASVTLGEYDEGEQVTTDAFTIENNTNNADFSDGFDVDVSASTDVVNGEIQLVATHFDTDDSVREHDESWGDDGNFTQVTPGQAVRVVVEINTEDDNDDLSGDVTIIAEQS